MADDRTLSYYISQKRGGTNAGVTVDVSQVEEAFERMDPKKFKSAVKKSFRQGINIIKKSVRNEVKQRYPGTQRHTPGGGMGMHFWWRNATNFKEYPALERDVKTGVWKNAKGSFITLAPNRAGTNRGAVLAWLNNGTAEREVMASKYRKSSRSSTRNYVYKTGGKSTGAIPANNFFSAPAHSALPSAQEKLSQGLVDNVIKAYNKQKTDQDTTSTN